MAESSIQLKQILEKIRNRTDQALTLLRDSQEQRALAWKCTGCDHVKRLTKAVSLEVYEGPSLWDPTPKAGAFSSLSLVKGQQVASVNLFC